MTSLLENILASGGAVARRLGEKYEFRPQQLEMAAAVEAALAEPHHLLVEAGTGVGKSFAYLLPAIDFAVKNHKRVVISTHTISLQEQLIEKDIPLLQAVYPDEFTAVLVKGRSNYLCLRRLQQAAQKANSLFEFERQTDSLFAVEQWARKTADGSLADLPVLPEPDVWDKVCAEHGNCLGKQCDHFEACFWQKAKRRMYSGSILIVNHALFFSDLALRMAGVNYLPKYDAVILDEAHTVEDVAGEHFGLKFTESGLRYQLRTLYDPKRGRGLLSVHSSVANDAIRDVEELYARADGFFAACVAWQQQHGRSNGRISGPDWIGNDLSPALHNLHLHIKAMLQHIHSEAESSELSAVADKIGAMGETLQAIIAQQLPDAVYWMELPTRGRSRVSLHGAPISVADVLREELFGKIGSVVLTSATLCTSAPREAASAPLPPVDQDPPRPARDGEQVREADPVSAIFAVCLRLADSLPPGIVQTWTSERGKVTQRAREEGRPLTEQESARLHQLFLQKVDCFLDAGHGQCWLRNPEVAQIVADELARRDGDRYDLLGWAIMPNHVHIVVRCRQAADLPAIMHVLQNATAQAANRSLRRTGDFWQREYDARIVRDRDDLRQAVEHAFGSPQRIGRHNHRWRGVNERAVEQLLGEPFEQPAFDPASLAVPAGADDATPIEADDNAAAFEYVQSRLGVDKARTLQLGSPFNYAEQATLYVEADLPEPNDPAFLPAACEKIAHYLNLTSGGAFVLFTSYAMLRSAADALRTRLEEMNLPLLVQGEGPPPRVLLERFRSTANAVLFGTSSFWQGIDVQGDQLRNVILVKLPFSVPDEPLTEARLDAIKRARGNPFMQYSVPEAIIRLKQGFGRLIRSRTDRGIVVILDSRVRTKRYGKLFLRALPQCRIGTA